MMPQPGDNELILQVSLPPMHPPTQAFSTMLVVIVVLVTTFALTTSTAASLSSTQRRLDQVAQSWVLPEPATVWHYNDLASDPITGCVGVGSSAFRMLRAYVNGGEEGIHWKYPREETDPDCLSHWTYYQEDSRTVVSSNIGSVTMNPRTKKSWCALNVYRVGGLKGKQWESCDCEASTENILSTSPVGLKAWSDYCSVPVTTIPNWYYNTRSTGPYNCTSKNDNSGEKWTMLNAYRSGGKKDVQWKYTDDPKDPECLVDWTYYAKDGVNKVADIRGRITKLGDKKEKNWCALPTYRSGGKQGYQWHYCICP